MEEVVKDLHSTFAALISEEESRKQFVNIFRAIKHLDVSNPRELRNLMRKDNKKIGLLSRLIETQQSLMSRYIAEDPGTFIYKVFEGSKKSNSTSDRNLSRIEALQSSCQHTRKTKRGQYQKVAYSRRRRKGIHEKCRRPRRSGFLVKQKNYPTIERSYKGAQGKLGETLSGMRSSTARGREGTQEGSVFFRSRLYQPPGLEQRRSQL